MKKTINFGKIDFYGCGRKINAVTVDVELRTRGGEPTFTIQDGKKEYTGRKTPEYLEFSVCGDIWNSKKTDCICGGQCLDTIAQYIKTPLFNKIYEYWKKYHLNSMNAGTPEQAAAVNEYLKKTGRRYDYTEICEYLKSIGLYEVYFTGRSVGREYNNELYRYGSAWLIEDLPEDVINDVKYIITTA